MISFFLDKSISIPVFSMDLFQEKSGEKKKKKTNIFASRLSFSMGSLL